MHSMFSGSAGSLTQVLMISNAPNRLTEKNNEYVRGDKVVNRGGTASFNLELHGSACRKSGAEACSKSINFTNH